MKLIRFGPSGAECPGVLLEDGRRLDLSLHYRDWSSAVLGEDGWTERLSNVVKEQGARLPIVEQHVRWAAPIARPGKIICIGLNYSDHAAETGAATPSEPIVFLKAPNTVVGPFDDILIPRGSTKTDWEVELGVVIGRKARYVQSVEAACGHIAGYVLTHDVSERHFQLERGGQWTKGKSCDAFNPLGPFLLSSDEIRAPDSLEMKLSVNGVPRQQGSTSTMIFDVPYLVHYLSQFMTLEPGDLISTGTPPGVGMGMKPPQFLKAGDVVELEISQLGSQRQRCIDAPGAMP